MQCDIFEAKYKQVYGQIFPCYTQENRSGLTQFAITTGCGFAGGGGGKEGEKIGARPDRTPSQPT